MKLFRSLIFLLFSLSNCISQVDIVLSSRFYHPSGPKDSLSTIGTLKEFGATRLDWMYYNKNSIPLDSLKQMGIPYSLTLNPMVPDSLHCTTRKCRIVDLFGQPYIAPWMRDWNSCNLMWGCVNNPDFEQLFYKRSKFLVEKGAYALFVDDSRLNDQAVGTSGDNCFCEHCMKRFSTYLQNNHLKNSSNFDYKQYRLRNPEKNEEYKLLLKHFILFQQQSVVRFLSDWKTEINRFSEGKIQFITNNYNGQWNQFYQLFDQGIAEMPYLTTTLSDVDSTLQIAKTINKKQLFSYTTENLEDYYKFFLHCYTHETVCLLPWDLLKTDTIGKVERMYMEPKLLSPLLDWMKSNPEIFTKQKSNEELANFSFEGKSIQHHIIFDGKNYYLFAYNELKDFSQVEISFARNKYKVKQIIPTLFPVNRKWRLKQINYTGTIILLQISKKNK